MMNITPLLFAARHKSREMIEMLISKGANINDKEFNYHTIILFSWIMIR